MNIYPAPIPVTQSKTEKFINKAILVHEDLYNYSEVIYVKAIEKVKILCNIHGEFYQSPNNHLNGRGCKFCADNITLTSEEFIKRAKNIHGELYNYNSVEYINAHIKVKIICKLHGLFEQTPNNHLNGKRCKKCNISISKISTKWLDSLDISDMIFEYRLSENKYKAVDGYCPSTNTVYQFHGDYWHGNPNNQKFKPEDIHPISKKTYGELYRKTIESDLWILSLGYNLVTMWESDFISK